MKKVIVESHVPFVGDAFKGIAEVAILPPEQITPQAVKDADAMIIRTRTRCNADLLDGSRIKCIATATIGTDHIDLRYCNAKGIRAVNAPGCNAPAVAQYVLASIITICNKVNGLTLGIIGLGHVGSIVADWALRLGMKVLACDPPRQETAAGWNREKPMENGNEPFATLSDIATKADIITFHTPHTKTGAHPTHHLADWKFFNECRRNPIIINAARGPITDTQAIIDARNNGLISSCVIDCWENEPNISADLLAIADIATPHIAGYSTEGKKRATQTAVNAILESFGSSHRIDLDVPSGTPLDLTTEAIINSYNPLDDTASLRKHPDAFERLRNTYHLRNEVK